MYANLILPNGIDHVYFYEIEFAKLIIRHHAPSVSYETEAADDLGNAVYSNKELSHITIYESASATHGYYIVSNDSIEYIDSDIHYEDVKSIDVKTWGGISPFLILSIADTKSEYLHIIDSETLGEISIKNPYEVVKEYISIEESSDKNTLAVTCSDYTFQITADNSNALETLRNSIHTDKGIVFGSDDTGIFADIPVTASSNNPLGSFRLYYEFDGIGLNCTSVEFTADNESL